MILHDALSQFWIIRIISESALMIFLILRMNLGVSKGSKVVERQGENGHPRVDENGPNWNQKNTTSFHENSVQLSEVVAIHT